MRRVLFLVLVVLGLVAITTPAAAASPTVEQFRIVGVDESFSAELTADCGFPVTVTVDAHETHIVFDNGTFQAIIHYHATVTGGGGTLILNNNFNEVISSESYRSAGTPFRVSTVDGRTLAKIAGLLIIEFADGTSTFHGSLRPDVFTFCDALQQQAP